MDKESVQQLIAGWGYYPLPKSHPDSPGYTGLLVAIRARPTGMHYDPERLHLRVFDAEGHSGWRTASWLSPIGESASVCPGPVTLYDQHDKRVDFFTFGGALQVFAEPGEFVYLIQSSAPILELTVPEETIPDQLAYETEALLSMIEEKLEELEPDRRQAVIDPLQLYLAALQSILSRYEQTPALQKTYQEFYKALRREKDWLVAERVWPAKRLSLEDLLPDCLADS